VAGDCLGEDVFLGEGKGEGCRGQSWALFLPSAILSLYPALLKWGEERKIRQSEVPGRRDLSAVQSTCSQGMFLAGRLRHLSAFQREFGASDLSLGQWRGSQEGIKLLLVGAAEQLTLGEPGVPVPFLRRDEQHLPCNAPEQPARDAHEAVSLQQQAGCCLSATCLFFPFSFYLAIDDF